MERNMPKQLKVGMLLDDNTLVVGVSTAKYYTQQMARDTFAKTNAIWSVMDPDWLDGNVVILQFKEPNYRLTLEEFLKDCPYAKHIKADKLQEVYEQEVPKDWYQVVPEKHIIDRLKNENSPNI
jgi:hypothetical protein